MGGLVVAGVPGGVVVAVVLAGLVVAVVPGGLVVVVVVAGLAGAVVPALPAQATARSSPTAMAEAINSFLSRLSPLFVARWASPVGFRSSHLYRVKTVSGDRRSKPRYCPPLRCGPAQAGTWATIPPGRLSRLFRSRGNICRSPCQNGLRVSPAGGSSTGQYLSG